MTDLTPEVLAEIRTVAAAATPGRWRWWGQVDSHVSLTTAGRGIIMVMGAKRLGMQEAEPTFGVRRPETQGMWGIGGVMTGASKLAIREVPYRDDIVDIDNPDARYIARMDPTTVLALLDRIAELTTELMDVRDSLRERVDG